MQMHTLMASHVMPLARVGEEIGLCASFAAGVKEHKAMLWNNRWVVHTNYYLESALEVFCLVEKRCLLVALGI